MAKDLELQKELFAIPIQQWLTNLDFLSNFFTQEEIVDAIFNTGLTFDLLTEQAINQTTLPHNNMPHVLVDTWTENKYVKGNNIVQVKRYTYIKPKEHQGPVQEQIFRSLMNTKFEWFRNFNWELYNMLGYNDKDFTMYLLTSTGSVYVPLNAVFAANTNAIFNFHTDYCSNYWENSRFDDKWDKLGEDLKPLHSPEYSRFVKTLNKFK